MFHRKGSNKGEKPKNPKRQRNLPKKMKDYEATDEQLCQDDGKAVLNIAVFLSWESSLSTLPTSVHSSQI